MVKMDEEAKKLYSELAAYYSTKVGTSFPKKDVLFTKGFNKKLQEALEEAYMKGYEKGMKESKEESK